jgi:hypothetical protein
MPTLVDIDAAIGKQQALVRRIAADVEVALSAQQLDRAAALRADLSEAQRVLGLTLEEYARRRAVTDTAPGWNWRKQD